MTVRLLAQGDAPDLQRYCFSRNTLEETQQRVEDALQRQENGELLQYVAEVDGHTVGTVTLEKASGALWAHRQELWSMVVAEEYQRRGIARAMFNACVEECRKSGAEMITLCVRGGEPAEEVYLKLGFQRYGKLERGLIEPWGECKVFDEVLMVYTL